MMLNTTQKRIKAMLKTLPQEIDFALSVLDGSGDYNRAERLVNDAAYALDYLSDELVKLKAPADAANNEATEV